MGRTDSFDIGRLRLKPGEGRHFELETVLEPLVFGGQRYEVVPAVVPVVLDVSRMSGSGHSLRLRFRASLIGPCMRCLQDAAPETSVDAREIDQPGGGDELASPYMHDEVLDVVAWARDAFALALPVQVLCGRTAPACVRSAAPTSTRRVRSMPTRPSPTPAGPSSASSSSSRRHLDRPDAFERHENGWDLPLPLLSSSPRRRSPSRA